MSFKREGNDDRWLSMIKKRRVAELLTEDIPEDEACIIKNGRLACLVCGHRPTFDTPEMLGIHRRGKKHLSNYEFFMRNKRELEELKEKRRADSYGELGMPLGSKDKPAVLGFLKSQAYDPRAKKKLKPDQRKTILQIAPGSETDATPSTGLPGYQTSVPKRAVPSETNTKEVTKSYSSGERNRTVHSQSSTPYGTRQVLPQTISDYIKNKNVRKRTFEIQPYTKKGEERKTNYDPENVKDSDFEFTDRTNKSSDYQEIPEKKKKSKPATVESKTPIDEETIRKKQLYLQATSSGWKLDWTGQKWIKDADVEFDSDEEPPELPC